MVLDAILAYLHLAAIFTLIWFLAREWTQLKAGAADLDVRRLARADLGYFIAAMGVLATGLARAFLGAKTWAFYAANPTFHAKVGLFVLVGVVSVFPTRLFLRWRRAAQADANFRVDDAQWRAARRWVMIEMHLVALIPLAAVFLARGFRL